MAESMIVVEKDTFDQEVLQADKPVLAYFWATWCQSCKKMSPQMEELAGENADRYKMVKIQIDSNPELTEQYGIMATPTILLFKPGKARPAEVQTGFAAKDWVSDNVNNFLKN